MLSVICNQSINRNHQSINRSIDRSTLIYKMLTRIDRSIHPSINQSINHLFAQALQHKYSREAIQYERDSKTLAALTVALKLAYLQLVTRRSTKYSVNLS